MPNTTYKQRNHILRAWLAGCVALLLCATTSHAAPGDKLKARVSIIIDDMGDQQEAGMQALQLPGAITYAFLPHTPHSQSQARAAHHMGKEVMLHLPMQAMSSNELLGPGSLTLDMTRAQFTATIRTSLAAVPHVAGINNHMGSLLTRHPGHMQWLMEEIKRQQRLYFIDSRTTHHTVANQLAHEFQVPSRQRDVFLDDDPEPSAITKQFFRLIAKAKKQGSAIGIGHPYESTTRVLRQLLPQLKQHNIELVAVSQLINTQPRTRIAKPESTTPGPLVMTQPIPSHTH